MARPKNTADIAPMIRGAFIRAAKGLEDDGKPLSEVIRQELEQRPLETLRVMASFMPKETKVSGKLEHDHKHTLEQLPKTNEWIEQFTVEGEVIEDKASSTH